MFPFLSNLGPFHLGEVNDGETKASRKSSKKDNREVSALSTPITSDSWLTSFRAAKRGRTFLPVVEALASTWV